MGKFTYYLGAATPALLAAGEELKSRGCPVVSRPCEGVTHLLLPVPSLDADGSIRGGGDPRQLLEKLPRSVTIMGGFLPQWMREGYRTVDFLEDARYLADNAAITAHCAIKEALAHLTLTLADCRVLVIGWGRIGKCLASLLKAMGAQVTVAARKESDLGMLHALGYHSVDLHTIWKGLCRYHIIFNTVPAPVLSAQLQESCSLSCLKMDLASIQGIEGEDVILARSLPGKDAPASSGMLIARTAIRLSEGKEQTQ